MSHLFGDCSSTETHHGHVHHRLRRICAAVGNRRVRFVSCSATIANPVEVGLTNHLAGSPLLKLSLV